jgi:chromosome partitioning protein
VCADAFDVQIRYQMEEREGGFAFFCSQKCLDASQRGGQDGGVVCDACAKRFHVSLAAHVVYVKQKRAYACSMDCRGQILREANGARLGELLAAPDSSVRRSSDLASPAGSPAASLPAPGAATSTAAPAAEPRASTPAAPAPSSAPETSRSPRAQAAPSAEVVPLVPRGAKDKPAARPQADTGRPRVLAVFNHKGGTGKTTTAVSVAAGLAMRGHKVLICDTDAQGNVGVSLGTTSERSLYHVLVMGLRVEDAVKTVRERLDLLPSNETLAAAELYLAGRQNRDRVLRDRLAAQTEGYDYVVLDCSPSLSLMNQNALVFADSVLVPVACDYLSLVGVRQVIKTVKNVNALLHHPVSIWGVLPTFFDARAKICHEAVGTLKEHFGERCLAPVRAAIKVKEAPAQGQTIFEYAAGASAAEDYAAVVDRIVADRSASAPASASDARGKSDELTTRKAL